MPSQPPVVGGTYDWFLNPARINTEAAPQVYGVWDITGATVTISFVSPSGVSYHFNATVTDGPGGKAHYINATTLFTPGAEGQWGYSWKVSLAGVVLETQIINFNVSASGAAAA